MFVTSHQEKRGYLVKINEVEEITSKQVSLKTAL
jgi:hypothetical protein